MNRYKRRQEKRPFREERKEEKRKRREKLPRRIEVKERKDLRIVTWNVQRMSLGTFNKRKVKDVIKIAERQEWDIVLLSEVRAESQGDVWFGSVEDNNLAVVIFSQKAAILLRGKCLGEWIEEGRRSMMHKRSVSVKFRDTVFTATYQPVFYGNNQAEIEEAKEDLKRHKEWAKSNEVLIIGGDFNAQVGGMEDRPGVCGNFGLRESNLQGVQLLDFCQENELCYVNSFYNHKNRGTWFSNFNKRWYELDGFLMKQNQRHKNVRKISTVWECSVSDHKPKIMICSLFHKRFSNKKSSREESS